MKFDCSGISFDYIYQVYKKILEIILHFIYRCKYASTLTEANSSTELFSPLSQW